ncbi:DUF5050 domain-containing protein [Peribacillus sp. NPDC096540]|uniref:DUF5050 domain-containing protein n=1 Tax=Peribacillus sp. NPDC096540 TaxID=3390612 RepID=UPI003D07BFBA
MKRNLWVFMVILLLVGCSEKSRKEFGEKEVPNQKGNSYGNVMNGGFVAKQDNLFIFMKYNNSGIPFFSRNSIMAKKEESSNDVKITSKGFGDLNVKGEWIYYTVMPFSDTPILYRVNVDGSGKEKLVEGAWYVQVVDEQVYYYDVIKNGLYKMNLDGKDKVHIYSPKAEVTMNFVVDHEQIYFYKPIDENGYDGKLYSMSLNGDNLKKLNDTLSNLQIIAGEDEESLYYTDEEESLFKVDKKNGKEIKISDQKFSSMFVDENWIYYLNAGEHYHLYKIKKNGDQNTLLLEKEMSEINILENWIYYQYDEFGDIYRIKTDGTENMLFSEKK